jgi:hypothetical protein
MNEAISLNGITVAESEFLALETLITISPNFRHPKLRFISVRNELKCSHSRL